MAKRKRDVPLLFWVLQAEKALTDQKMALLDAYTNYLEYGTTPDARNLTDAEEQAKRRAMLERCREEAMK